jgi:hypothetical protein
MTDEELIKQYRDQQSALNGGCSDGYCVIAKPVGMHTNGGCSCLSNLDFLGRQRVGVMLKNAQAMADRIEELLKDNYRWKMECEEFWRKREEAAEVKLAKTVDVIKVILFTAHADDHQGWHDALDDAQKLITEQEKTE